MHDFQSRVRELLGSLEIPEEREAEIIEEIAEHMRGAYEEALDHGASEQEGLSIAEAPFVPWDALSQEIRAVEQPPTSDDGGDERTAFGTGGKVGEGLGTLLAGLLQDFRFSLRTLRRRTLFTVAAVGTLGLGVGATTTMFSVVDGVLLRQLPFPGSSELVSVWATRPDVGRDLRFSWQDCLEIRENYTVFQEMAAYRPDRLILTGSGEPASLLAGVATASLFPMLGVVPQLGRLFQEGEDGASAAQIAILSGELWQSRFGSDPEVIGRTIYLGDAPFEVAGVLPMGFRLRNRGLHSEIETGVDTGERDIWVPLGFDGVDLQSWNRALEILGRLRPGVSLAQATAEVDGLLRGGQDPSELRFNVAPFKEEDTARVRLPLLLLLAASGILCLVACANLATLLMGEAVNRRQEVRTRMAMGASRSKVIRIFLAESLLLGLGGGTLGFLLAIAGVHLARTVGPYLPGLEGVRINHGILAFAISLGVLSGFVFGLFPALGGARQFLSLTGRDVDGPGGRQVQKHLVALVVSLTTVLLVAGGLLTRSFLNLIELDTGFRADHLATVRLPVLPGGYPEEPEEVRSRNAFLRQVVAQIEAIPGVLGASGADNLPFPGARSGHRVRLPESDEWLQTPLRRVLPSYHEVMGIPVVAGRGFQHTDVMGNAPVAIISQAAADYFWPEGGAVGGTINHQAYGDLAVVGVVGEVLEGWVDLEPRPMVYLPLFQVPNDEVSLIARTAGDPTHSLGQMRDAVWSVDPEVAVAMETTMEALAADLVMSERYRTLLVVFFGASAMLLAAFGVFGVSARSVALRTRELGIRTALGAGPSGLALMVLKEGLSSTLAGGALGLIGAWWISRLLAGFLFGVAPSDPITYAMAGSLLTAVCLLAGYLPTRRIARLDPASALKSE